MCRNNKHNLKTDAGGNLLHDTGSSNLVLRDILETWEWGGRWEKASRGRLCIYTYVWFMLIYGRNQHSIVKQLSSN